MNDRERLQQWMSTESISAATLAKRMGMSRAAVSYLLSGDRRISPNFKWLFGDAFGNDVANQLFRGEQAANKEAEPV